jgi:hypothetical protein
MAPSISGWLLAALACGSSKRNKAEAMSKAKSNSDSDRIPSGRFNMRSLADKNYTKLIFGGDIFDR